MPFDSSSLIISTRVAPGLDPTMKAAIAAQSGDLAEVMNLSGGVAAFGGAARLRSQLQDQDEAIQARLWKNANESTRRLLGGVGYRPPEDEDAKAHAKRGGIGSILHAVTRPFALGVEVASDTAMDAVGDVLHAAGSPLRQVQHLYRAAALITDENVLAGRGQWSLQGTFSPGTWMRTWDASKNGENTISPVALLKANELYGEDRTDIARQMASGMSMDEVVLAAPENERAGLVQMIQNDPEFGDALAYLNAAHLSLGRRLVNSSLAVTNPGLHRTLSGGADALFGWFGDPLVIGSKVAKADQVAKYAVKNAKDFDWLVSAANQSRAALAVRREADDVLMLLKEGGPALLMAERPQWAGVANEIQDFTTVDQLHKWLRAEAGMLAMRRGTLSGLHTVETAMPHLTNRRAVGLWMKNETKKGIDWLADDVGIWGAKDVGQFARRLVTQLPEVTRLNPDAPNAGKTFLHVARQFLPEAQARKLTNEWMSPGLTLGERKDRYVSMLDEMREAAGIEADNPWWTHFKSGLDDDVAGQIYSPAEHATGKSIDTMNIDGTPARMGFLEDQLSSSWAIPSYKDFLTATRKARMTGLDKSRDAMEVFMNEYWKPSLLLRPAFAIRSAGEEVIFAMMRYSPAAITKAKAAGIATSVGPLTPGDPMHKVWTMFTGHMPEALRGAIDTPQRLMGAVLFDNAQRATRAMAGKIAGPEMLKAAEDLANDPAALASFARFVSSAQRRGGGYLDNAEIERIWFNDGKARAAFLKTTGRFEGYTNGTKMFDYNLHGNLQEIATSRLGRRALETADQGRDAQVAAVVGVLRDPSMRKVRERAVRNTRLSDGRLVGKPNVAPEIWRDLEMPDAEIQRTLRNHSLPEEGWGNPSQLTAHGDEALRVLRNRREELRRTWGEMERGSMESEALLARIVPVERRINDMEYVIEQVSVGTATQAEAWNDWAGVVTDHVNSLIHSEAGERIMPDITSRLLDGDIPDVTSLGGLPSNMKPFMVKGPEILEEKRNFLRGLIDEGFYHMVGKPIDWMIRQPLFLHNYANAGKQVEALRALGVGDDVIQKARIDRAVADTIPYIDDPRLRSQFNMQVRNLFPFMFAQEQFYKRIARNLAFNPAAFRQAQLVMMGVRHVGIMHKDNEGNDYFFYPGAGVVQEVLAQGVKAFTGVDAVFPMPVGFSGQVRFAAPGLDSLSIPSASPVIGIPLRFVASRFPELGGVEETVMGERGAGRSYWEMVVPSSVSRIVKAFIASPETDAQMASSMKQAIQYLEAAGHGLPEGANDNEIELWQERVQQWSRSLLLARAVLGFVVPSSPQAELDPKNMSQELRTLFGSGVPYEEAVRLFIEKNPDATPFTVFPTRSSSGGSLPSTKTAAKFITENAELLAQYPSAGGWLIPQVSSDKTFSPLAYREQLALELRRKKTPLQFWRDVKYAQAANVYFSARDDHDARLEEVKGNAARTREINQIWTNWKDEFLAAHPIFETMLQDPQGSIRRGLVLDEMRQIITDGEIPVSKQTDNLKTFMQAYDDLSFQLAPLRNLHDSRSTRLRANYKAIFSSWAEAYAKENPDVSSFYLAVIKPEVEQ
jgi:hypothetical protein